MKENFSPETKNFKDLLSSDTIYEIPKFQRDYSWDNKNYEWDELWNDIIAKDIDEHFVGFIVLKKITDNKFEVIDGQQRLATITIIIIAALYILKNLIKNNSNEDKTRLTDFIQNYIGKKDPVTREFYNKLILNRINGKYFKKISDGVMIDSSNTLDFVGDELKNKSNKKIEKALNFFKGKISSLFTNNFNSTKISSFIEGMTKKLFFTVLYVDSDYNAYTLFETLNARGIKLAAVDLLKNFLYSKTATNQTYLGVMENNWNEITSNIKEGDINKFIRTDWGTRYSLVEDRILFKTISKTINNEKKAFKYMEMLKDSSNIFSLLQNPKDSYWKENGYNPIIVKILENINLLQLKQIYGVLIAYLKHMEKNKFHILISWLEKISFRFNTISGFDAKEQETVYNEISNKISSKQIKTLDGIKKHLKKIYVDRVTFINNFSNAEIKRVSIIKYILREIFDRQYGIEIDSDSFTVEHILAKNENSDWSKFKEPENYVWKLGNLVLLQKSINEQLKNKPFSKKKLVYSKNNYEFVKALTIFSDWNEKTINKRQQDMASIAQEIWKIEDFE